MYEKGVLKNEQDNQGDSSDEQSDTLVSEIEEVGADIGEPDCKLTNPLKFDMKISTHSLVFDVTNCLDKTNL